MAAGDTILLEAPVTLGDTTPRTFPATTRRSFEVVLPGGIPVDSPVRVEIMRRDAAGAVAEEWDTSGLRVRLVLAGSGSGSESGSGSGSEDIPVLSVGPDRAVAVRRPPVRVAVVLALLGFVIVFWILEVVPLFVTSLAIPVVLAVSGVASAPASLAPFFDPIIVLFFAGFLMAEAMRRVALDHWAAVTIVAKLGTSPVRLYLALIGVSAFLSMWMSNTAAVTVLIPVALAVTAPLQSVAYRKAAILGIAYAATIGGVGSAIGTPANQLAIRFVHGLTGREISFVEWFGFGLPLVVLFLPLMAFYLWKVSGVRVDRERFSAMRTEAKSQRAALGAFTREQTTVLVVFAFVVAGWLTQQWHHVSSGIVALAGAVSMFVLRRLKPGDLGRISWTTLLTFGGGLALGDAMVQSGTADWLITRLGALRDVPQFWGIAAVAAFALLMTTVASNTAAAATLVPLAIPLAGVLGVSPVVLAVMVAAASSIDFALVIGTPPTMLAYDTGLFTAREILKKGALLDVLGLLVLVTAVAGLWRLFGLV